MEGPVHDAIRENALLRARLSSAQQRIKELADTMCLLEAALGMLSATPGTANVSGSNVTAPTDPARDGSNATAAGQSTSTSQQAVQMAAQALTRVKRKIVQVRKEDDCDDSSDSRDDAQFEPDDVAAAAARGTSRRASARKSTAAAAAVAQQSGADLLVTAAALADKLDSDDGPESMDTAEGDALAAEYASDGSSDDAGDDDAEPAVPGKRRSRGRVSSTEEAAGAPVKRPRAAANPKDDAGVSDSSYAQGGEPGPRRRSKRSTTEDDGVGDGSAADENARKGKMNDAERERVEAFVTGVSNGTVVVHRGDLARKLQQFVNPKRPREFYEKLVSRRSLNHVLSSFLRPRLPRRRSAAAMRLAMEVSAALEHERRPSVKPLVELRVAAGMRGMTPPAALSPAGMAPMSALAGLPSTTAAMVHMHPGSVWAASGQGWQPQGAGAFPQPPQHMPRMDVHPQYVDARAYEWARSQMHANRARGGGGTSDDAAAGGSVYATAPFVPQGVSFSSLYAQPSHPTMMPFARGMSEEAMRAHANAAAMSSMQAYAPIHTALRTATIPTFTMAMPAAASPVADGVKQLAAAEPLPPAAAIAAV